MLEEQQSAVEGAVILQRLSPVLIVCQCSLVVPNIKTNYLTYFLLNVLLVAIQVVLKHHISFDVPDYLQERLTNFIDFVLVVY